MVMSVYSAPIRLNIAIAMMSFCCTINFVATVL